MIMRALLSARFCAVTLPTVLCLGLAVFISGCPNVGIPATCTTDAQCDDGDVCTADTCNADGVCVNEALLCPNGKPIDLGTASPDFIALLDVVSKINSITIASPPVLNFSVTTADGAPITGIGELWQESDRYVRFTLTKLVPGTNGDSSTRIAYTRDETNDGSTPPDYDTGSSLVDHGDGTYTFTFKTDVAAVSGVPYEPTLSHRVAGQIGSRSVPLEAQNLFMDFVPDGSAITETRDIAVMDSCNECHDGLVFHGRRFKVEYCVQCHTSELAGGEGDMGPMIHKIHSSQAFDQLDDGIDYSEVTYPQGLNNCRKCHSAGDMATPDGDNWKNVPTIASCGSCHSNVNFATGENHAGGPAVDNASCAGCHPASGGPAGIEDSHLTLNATPNNPNLPAGVPDVRFNISNVDVDADGFPQVTFSVTADGTPLDMNNLPDGFIDADSDAFRWPVFLLAWAQSQDGITEPVDFNNLGNSAGQPTSVSLGNLVDAAAVDCTGADCTADFSGTGDGFPTGAMMRTVSLQGYFRFDADGDESYDYSLHTISAVRGATDDLQRRQIIDPAKCGDCHEWFEGHGGNRVVGLQLDPDAPQQPMVCTLCHVPNLSTSGRAIDPADAADRDGDPLTDDPSSATVALGNSDTWDWPEDTNSMKEMIHGIHAAAMRENEYEFVRGRNDGIYYNWAEVTFPAEDGISNCLLCHIEGTFGLPLPDGVLDTTVRTTGSNDGLDADDFVSVGSARGSVPNLTDWVNSSVSSTCYYCHDSDVAVAHMRQNGGILSIANPAMNDFVQRQEINMVESCTLCHGADKIADVNAVHNIK